MQYVRGVDQQSEEIPRATSYEKRRSLDAAAAVERQRLKKRRARNSRTGSTASATEPPCQSITELSLVSMPVEPAYSMPWNSPECSDQGAGFDGLDQDLSSTSSVQFCAHVAVDNISSLEVGSQYLEPETHDTEDCEDGSRFVQIVEASGRYWDGDHVSSSTESAAAWEAAGRPLESMSPRARIQLFRQQISGKVNIPETWPGEEKLKDWACHSDVEDALRPLGLMLATASLVEDSLSRHV
ncbi:unnamed protein product [Sphagnum compactum]